MWREIKKGNIMSNCIGNFDIFQLQRVSDHLGAQLKLPLLEITRPLNLPAFGMIHIFVLDA